MNDLSWVEILHKFYVGPMDTYDRNTDPTEYLKAFDGLIKMLHGNVKVTTNILPTCLRGLARAWLTNQRLGSIYSWEKLCDLLIANCQGTGRHPGGVYEI